MLSGVMMWNSLVREGEKLLKRAESAETEVSRLQAQIALGEVQAQARQQSLDDVRNEVIASHAMIDLQRKHICRLQTSMFDPDRTRGTARVDAYLAIDSERDFQEQDKHWDKAPSHPVGAWLTLLQVYVTKAQAAWCGEAGHAQGLAGVRKVAAIAVACMEEHGAPRR